MTERPHLPWSAVKPKALAMREAAVNALITASADQITTLQIRVQTIDQFIGWFESGAPQDRMMGDESSPPGY